MDTEDQLLLEQQQGDREFIVRVYTLYRLLIACVLLALVLLPQFGALLRIQPQPGFTLPVGLYMASSVLAAVTSLRHLATQESSTRLMLWSDILLLPLIMVYAGDFATSIGMLLALSFLLGSMPVQQGYAVRALAATVLLIAALWTSQHFATGANLNLRNSLSMGFAYLVIGLLSSRLARYLHITEQVVLRQRLKLKNQVDVNAFIIQQLDSGALVIDPKHRVQYGNRAAWRLLGRNPEDEYRGRPLSTLSTSLDVALTQWQANAASRPGQTSAVMLTEDVSACFTSLGSGSDGGILVSLADQKEIRKRSQQLKLASLGQLTAGVAHEIRNPLSAIHQATQLLQASSQHNPQQKRLLEIIQANTTRMNRQVEEILQLSRPSPSRTSVQLNTWLQQLIEEYRETSLSDGQQLLMEIPDTPCRINFNAEQLRQVLVNLIANAQQHSKLADIELVIRVKVDCPLGGDVTCLEVSDNGESIPVEIRDKLFDPFFTTGNSGAGLGLYLSRELCLYNHAELDFITEEKGDAFRICGESGQL